MDKNKEQKYTVYHTHKYREKLTNRGTFDNLQMAIKNIHEYKGDKSTVHITKLSDNLWISSKGTPTFLVSTFNLK